MNTNDNSSINEIADLLNIESSKLQDTIDHGLKNLEKLTLAEIIEAYYQAINVTSITKMLKENSEVIKELEESSKIRMQIKKVENDMDEKFDKNFHRLILSQLNQAIEDSKSKIKEIRTKQIEKTKEEIEKQGEIYQKLRQTMSTKEFVDQYDKELKK